MSSKSIIIALVALFAIALANAQSLHPINSAEHKSSPSTAISERSNSQFSSLNSQFPQDSLRPLAASARKSSSELDSPLALRSNSQFSTLNSQFTTSLSLYATVGLGKHSPSGVGFGKSISMLYAVPLTSRLSVMGGAFLDDFSWGSYHSRALDVFGSATYQISPHFNFSAFAEKSLIKDRAYPHGYRYMDNNLLPMMDFQDQKSFFSGHISIYSGDATTRTGVDFGFHW